MNRLDRETMTGEAYQPWASKNERESKVIRLHGPRCECGSRADLSVTESSVTKFYCYSCADDERGIRRLWENE